MEHPTVVIDMLDRTTGTGSSPSAASALSLWGLVALCSAVLGLFPSRADGQEGSLQGRVRDADGASVFAAVVDLLRAGDSIPLRTSETDALGYYLFEDLEAGTYELRVGRLGYFQARVTAFVAPSEPTVVDVALRETALEIQGLSVEVERSRERARFEAQAGLTSSELAGADLKKIPGVAESDPIRAVEVLPGVVSTSDFTAAFNVRGGSADQNLILLDGLPVFNPFHLGGVFSVFNADMVQRAELLAGGFPAEYGGRVSSVLTIESDAGNGDWDVDTGISLLAARAAVGGGLPASARDRLGLNTARWRVSGRRSYFDQVLRPAFDFPYHLTDLQGVFEAWMDGGSRLTVTGYTGNDVLSFSEVEDTDFPLKIDWGWGNDVIGLRWTAPNARGNSLELRGGFSRFDTELGFPEFADTEIRSRLGLFTAGFDIERRPRAHWTLKGGVQADRYAYDNLFSTGGTEFRTGTGDGWQLGAYVQGTWRARERWLVEVGGRLDTWLPDPGGSSSDISPRLAVKGFFGGRNWAVKASVGRFTQFLHSVRDEELPLGLDIWVLSGSRAPVVRSDQVQAGIEGYPGHDWFVSLEAYARDFRGVITNNLADDPNDPLDDLSPGSGRSHGADLFIRRTGEGVTGWLTVSWLNAHRAFPDFNAGFDPPPEITYPPVFDRRLDIDLVLSFQLGWQIDGGLRWNLGTGLPYTRPIGVYPSYSFRQTREAPFVWQGALGEEGTDYAVLLGERNAARYPTYHRLDLSFRRTSEKSWGTVTPYLDILNVYNRKNVLFYVFDYQDDPATRSGVSMFPILPTMGVEVSF